MFRIAWEEYYSSRPLSDLFLKRVLRCETVTGSLFKNDDGGDEIDGRKTIVGQVMMSLIIF